MPDRAGLRGPVDDWKPHLARMYAFWSSVMLMTGRYHGQPMQSICRCRSTPSTSTAGSRCSRRRRAICRPPRRRSLHRARATHRREPGARHRRRARRAAAQGRALPGPFQSGPDAPLDRKPEPTLPHAFIPATIAANVDPASLVCCRRSEALRGRSAAAPPDGLTELVSIDCGERGPCGRGRQLAQGRPDLLALRSGTCSRSPRSLLIAAIVRPSRP